MDHYSATSVDSYRIVALSYLMPPITTLRIDICGTVGVVAV
jgi:hypothetical protein